MKDTRVHSCTVERRQVIVYERSSDFGMGPMVVEVYYDCVAPSWPKVRIRARRGLFALLARLGHRPGLELDLPAFHEAFRVDAEDEDFAIALLSLEMQQFILEKRNVDWSVGHGHLKLFYRGRLRRTRMTRSLDRLRQFWRHVAPELEQWSA